MTTLNTTRIVSMTSILSAAVLLLGGALSVHAAEPGSWTRTAKLSLSDLDLSTAAGQQAARERLHQIARRICTQVEDELDLSHQANYGKCVESVKAQAEPTLTAMIRRDAVIRTAAVDPIAR